MVRTAQVPSVAIPPRVPLVTTIQSRSSSLNKDARLINVFAELEPVSGEYWVQKRPGLVRTTTIGSTGRGIYSWQGATYSVFGSLLRRGSTSLGTVDTTGGKYKFEELLGTGWLVLNNGVGAYFVDTSTLVRFELEKFRNVMPGEYIVGVSYQILVPGNFNFVSIGSANNNIGTVFTATGPGDRTKTGEASLSVTGLIVGVRYEISFVGTTDFTLIGAASNTVGVRFTATGPGTGTGTVEIPNFPESHVKGWAYLNGTLYVMDANSRIYGTSTLMVGGIGGLDDPRIWDTLSVIVARTGAGNGVSLARHYSYVVALKSRSTEFFYDAGNPAGSPLAPVPGAYSTFGCISADSVQDIKENILWVSASSMAAPQAVRLDNLVITVVSTPPIERLLRSGTFSSLLSWSFEYCGHRFYGVTVPSGTLVYDLGQNLWYEWSGEFADIVDSTSAASLTTQTAILQEFSGGFGSRVFEVKADYEVPNDDGVLFTSEIYTPNFDGDTDRRKTLSAMYFQADQQPGCKLEIRVSDDDYETWTNFREVDLSRKVPVLQNCGTFVRRAWHLRYRGNTAMRLKGIGMQIDLGTI